MLPKQERLTRSSEFAYVYKQKKYVANFLLILYIGNKKSNLSKPTQVGFVVSKKIDKRSTTRNRIKRLIREAYKKAKIQENFSLNNYQNLIFIARADSAQANFQTIHSAVIDCINKASKKFK